MSLKTVFREKELWILILLGILYFYRLLFLGEIFFIRDLFSHFVPQRQLLIDYVKAGEFPWWDPYLNGGRPYLTHISNSSFYPSNLLYFFFPLLRAFNLDIVLHFIGYLTFAYLLSRIIGLQPISSLIVGVVYGFCGYTLSLISILNLFWAMSYLPLLVLFWHLFLLERKRRWGILIVFVGIIQVFAGAPEVSVITLLSLLGWTLFYPYPHISIPRKVINWLVLGMFILGISSIQIFPTVDLLMHAPRGRRMDYASFSYWSLPPRRLPELIFPGFFGHINTLLPQIYYWGGKVTKEGVPYIFSIYFGCATIALAIVGGIRKDHDHIFPFRVRFFLLLLFALSLLFSLGNALPFFYMIYKYIPLVTVFRYPNKCLIAGLLPLALLTGYAAEVLFGEHSHTFRRSQKETIPDYGTSRFHFSKIVIVLWGILALLCVFTVTFWLLKDFSKPIQGFFFDQPDGEVIHRGLVSSFTHASIIGFLTILLYHYRCLKKRQWQSYLLVCILVVDLLSTGKRVNPYAPEEFFTEVPPVVQAVRNNIGEGRLFRPEEEFSKFTLQAPSNDVMWMFRWKIEGLYSHLAVFYRIPVIFHSDTVNLVPVHLAKLRTLIDSLSWEQRLPLLSAGGVTLILTSDDISIPGMSRIAEIPNRSDIPFYLYQNKTVAARIEFVTTWSYAASDNEALKAMRSQDYDPRKYVVLQEPKSTFFDLLFRTPKIKDIPQSPSTSLMTGPSRGEYVSPEPSTCREAFRLKNHLSNTHSAIFTVSNSCDGYLVFSEPFYPGWRVYVDEKPTPILRANLAFSAVFLPAGEHEVKRRYRPNSLLFGVLSSMLFCMLLCLVMYKKWFFRIHGK